MQATVRLYQYVPRLQLGLARRTASLAAYHSCVGAGSSFSPFGRMHEAARLASMARSASTEKLHAAANGTTAWRRSPTPQTPDLRAASPAASPFSGSSGSSSRCSSITTISSAGAAAGRLGLTVTRSLSRSLSMSDWGRPLPWLRLPDELWGAVNAITAAANPATEKPPRGAGFSTKAAASSTASAELAPEPEEVLPPSSSLRERLDYRPRLTNGQVAVCTFVATAVCVLVFAIRHPIHVSPPYALAMGALFAGTLVASRFFLLEREFRRRLVPESELADSHSRFRTIEGIKVHYRVEYPPQGADAEATNIAAVHCYHGFGANTFSWSFTQAALAARLCAIVTAHDMPGFGLTQRVTHASAYTLEGNGRLGRCVMDAELSAQGSNSQRGAAGTQGRDPGRVLMGHSLGAACAAAEVIANPEGVDALVLVAPAIVAMSFGWHERKEEAHAEAAALASGDKVAAAKAAASSAEFQSNTAGRLMKRIGATRNRALRLVAAFGYAAIATATRCALWVATPVLVQGLRASVRSRAFWERGLARAWHRKAGVTEAVVDNYRLPQLVNGWEAGLLAFLRARVAAGKPFGERLAAAYHGNEAMTQVEQLVDAVTRHSIRVLIVHGENDALVPFRNSRKLAQIIPDAQFAGLSACGHNPQEEKPQDFVNIVSKFLAQ